jgi:hypothetical protein
MTSSRRQRRRFRHFVALLFVQDASVLLHGRSRHRFRSQWRLVDRETLNRSATDLPQLVRDLAWTIVHGQWM